MKKRFTIAALSLVAALLAAPVAWADDDDDDGPKKPKTSKVTLLALNDFHGHLEAHTPGRINDPATGASVLAGGAEYVSTHMQAHGAFNRDTYVVSSGDLIGASPLLSGLFHDEPTIDVMNHIGLDFNGVGNHEFDEGKAELLRMQRGNSAVSTITTTTTMTTTTTETCSAASARTGAIRSTAAKTARRSRDRCSSSSPRT